jgi:hypothetical protein
MSAGVITFQLYTSFRNAPVHAIYYFCTEIPNTFMYRTMQSQMKILWYFHCFYITRKLLTTMAFIKLSDEYDDFKALVRALRD